MIISPEFIADPTPKAIVRSQPAVIERKNAGSKKYEVMNFTAGWPRLHQLVTME